MSISWHRVNTPWAILTVEYDAALKREGVRRPPLHTPGRNLTLYAGSDSKDAVLCTSE
jgi:hypothetical protein